MHIDELLKLMLEKNASDLHIKVGSPPLMRIDGVIGPLEDFELLKPKDTKEMIYNILTESQKKTLEEELELDFAYNLPGVARFRVNVFYQRGSLGGVMRLVPFHILTIGELGLPEVTKELSMRPRGLVLVTGPAGSGKSTTLAAMIDYINSKRRCHIMTIEDPIEFVHNDKISLVNQRELGEDTKSFATALKYVLRQDPDVILVGEMRDLETIAAAVTAAETGHLVLSTLHTTEAATTVDRVIDVFPPHQQQQIRMQLSVNLLGVISQTLIKRQDNPGRVAAFEIMTATPAIKSMIREAKTHQIYSTIQMSFQLGMLTLDQSLVSLYKKGIINYEDALSKSSSLESFKQILGVDEKKDKIGINQRR